jgi:fibronectin-binding autotransporter adhesin
MLEKLTQKLTHLIVFLLAVGAQTAAFSNPAGGQVTSGQATITQSGSNTTINQTSNQAILNWQSFNIGAGEKTSFHQPTNGVALNRINPQQGASQIYGALSATGRIILINGAGVHFGPSSTVNVGSIIVSTSDISNSNFHHHKYIFDVPSQYAGSIINEGSIKTADYGLVALLGTGVVNSGTISAKLGSIALGAGSKFTLDFNGDQMINFTVDGEAKTAGVDQNGKSLKSGVTNTGSLLADGGQILVTARVAKGVLDNVIDMRGVAQARSVHQHNGVIILSAGSGTVRVAGRLNVSGRHKHSKGGTIQVLGDNVILTSSANLNASGTLGGGNINIGGNEHGIGSLQNATTTTVEKGAVLNASAIESGNGGNVIVWSNGTTNYSGSILAMGGATSGDGGFSEVSGKSLLNFVGTADLTAVKGAIGNLLLDPGDITIQTTGPDAITVNGSSYTPNQAESILTVATLQAALASANVTVQTTGDSNSGANGGSITVANALTWSSAFTLTLNAASNINLNANITATNGGLTLTAGSNTALITSTSSSTGVTANIAVANLSITKGNWTQVNTTLLPTLTATNNFTLTSGVTFIRAIGGTGASATPYQIVDVYGLQGINTAQSFNYQLAGDIDATGTINWNGGLGFTGISSFGNTLDGASHVINGLTQYLVGQTNGGLFANLSGTVKNLGLTNVNIKAGLNAGGISANASGATLTNVYVTGVVANNLPTNYYYASSGSVGGLIGYADGITISNSYNTAAITGGNGTSGNNSTDRGYAGGLVGEMNNGTITNSYSSIGLINAGQSGGGLVGFVDTTNSSTISTSWSSSRVQSTDSQGSNLGALVGYSVFQSTNPTLTITNSYWDSNTANQGSAYPSASGQYGNKPPVLNNVSGESTSTLQQGTSAGYSGFTFNTSGPWEIGPTGYAYLVSNRLVGGTLTGAGSGKTVNIYQNGTLLGSATTNAASGFYYTAVNGAGLTAGATLLFAVTTSGSYGNAISMMPAAGNDSVSMALNTVSLGDTTSSSYTTANLGSALTGITVNSSILFSVSGSTLTLGNGGSDTTINFLTTPSTSFSLGSIAFSSGTSGSINLAGPVTLTQNSSLTGTAITLGSVTGSGFSLALSSSANNLSGSVSGLTTLALSGGGTDLISGSISTSGTQTYSDALNIAGTDTLSTTNSAITFSGALNGLGTSALTLAAGSGTIGFNTIGATTALTSLSSMGSGVVTFNNGIAAIGSVSVSGASTISGNISSTAGQTFSGTATLGGNIIFASSSSGTISLASVVGNTHGLTINTAGNASINGVFSNGTGTSSLTQTGTGTLTLNAANTYTGGTTITNGTVKLGTTSALPSTGSVAIATGATLDLNGNNSTVSSVTGVGNLTNSSGSAGTLTLTLGASNATFAGLLSGNANLQIGSTSADTGIFTLSGNNSGYTGTITANFGTFSVTSLTPLGSAILQANTNGTISLAPTVATTFANTITGNGGTIIDGGSGLTNVFSNLTLSANSFITVTNSNEILQVSNVVTGSAGLTKQGAGALQLMSANTYTGPTAITAGSLVLEVNNAIGSGSALSISSGATFNMNAFSDIIGPLTGAGSITNNSAGLTVAQGSGTSTYSGALAGSGGFTVGNSAADTGTEILSGSNTLYTGVINITDGKLQVNGTGGLGGATGVNVNTSGTLVLNTTATTTFTNLITAKGGGITDASTGQTNTLSNLALNTATSLTLTVTNAGETLIVNDALSGTGGLSKAGAGLLKLSAANTYSGTTLLSAGTLQLGIANAIGSSSALTLTSGSFDMNSFSDTVGALSGSANIINLASSKILTVDQGSVANTYSGIIAGAGSLTVGSSSSDSGTLTLSGVNTFSGTTTVAFGTLALGVNNALASGLSVSSGATFSMGTFSDLIGPLSGAGSITNLSTGKTLTVAQGSGSNTFSGTIAGAGALAVGNSAADTGTLILSGANSSYTGALSVNDGILQLNSAGTISNGSVSANSGGTLSFNTTAASSFANVTGNGGTITDASSGHTNTISIFTLSATTAFSVTNSNETLAITNAFSGTGFGISKAGSGLLQLNGANTYTGATTVTAGTLQLGVANAVGSSSALTLTGGTFDMNSLSDSVGVLSGAGNVSNLVSGQTLTVAQGSGSNTYSGIISGAGNLTVGKTSGDTGTLTLSGVNTLSGLTTVSFGTLTLGVANALATNLSIASGANFNMNSFSDSIGILSGAGNINGLATSKTLTVAEGTGSNTFSGVITGAGSLVVGNSAADTGTLILTGANGTSYTGQTAVSFGTLQVATTAPLGTGGVKVNASGILSLVPTVTTTFSGAIVGNGGTITDASASNLGTTLSNLSLSATSTLSVSTAAEVFNVNNAVSGAGFGITKTGAGILELSGLNTYTGATSISTGTLELGLANALNVGSALSVVAGATFNMNNLSDAIGPLSGAGSITNLASSQTLTIASGTTTNIYSGVISGAGNLKIGNSSADSTGTLQLSGTNTFTGNVTIAFGGLILGSSTALPTGGAINVASGATFNMNSFSASVGVLTGAGSITNLSTGKTLTVAQGSGSNTYSGTLSGAGNLTIGNSASDTGTFILSGNNTTLTGTTQVAFGILQANAANSLGNSTAITTVSSGAELVLSTSAGASFVSQITLNGTGISSAGALIDASSGLTNTISSLVLGSSSSIGVTNSNETLNVTNAVSGTGLGITKIGAGTLELSGLNTYTGQTAISAGTLELGVANAVNVGSALSVASGATFNMNSLSDAVGVLTGAGSISGLTTGKTLTVAQGSGSNIFSGVIAGAGNLTVGNSSADSGTLQLSGANTLTGTTSISFGTLQLGAANAIAAGSALSVGSGANFDMNSFSDTVGALSGAGSIKNLATGKTLTVAEGANTTTFSGTLAGAGNFTLGSSSSDNTGTLTLSGANTYTGATTISFGNLKLGANNAVGAGALTVASGATFNMNGFSNLVGVLTGAGSITNLNSAQTLTVAEGSGSNTYSGTIAGAGNFTLGNSTADTGTFILSGTNTSFGGGATVAFGNLQLNNASAAGTATIAINTAALLTLNTTANSSFSNAITFNGGGLVDNSSGVTNTLSNLAALSSAAAFTVTNSNETLKITSAISGSFGLSKAGAGALTLANANLYTGATTLTAGSINLTNGTALSSGSVSLSTGTALNVSGGISVGNAVTLVGSASLNDIGTTGTDTLTGAITLGATSILSASSGSTLKFTNTLSGNSDLTMSGAGTINLQGAVSGLTSLSATVTNLALGSTISSSGGQTYTSAVSLTAPVTLNVSAGGVTMGTVTGNGNSLTINVSGASSITNYADGTPTGSSLVKQGAGTLTLGSASTYSGGTTITSGTITSTNGSSFGSGAIAVQDGATLNLGSGVTIANAINLTGSAGLSAASGTDVLSGAVTLGTANNINVASGSTLTFSNTLNGASALSLSGAGTLVFQNTVSGLTSLSSTVSNLTLSANVSSTGLQSYTSPVTLGSAVTLTSSAGAVTLGSVAGAGNNLTINNSGNSSLANFNNSTGTSSLTKQGAGTLTITGASNYNGGTTISSGAITISNNTALGTGAVAISTGSALNVNGGLTVGNALNLSGTGAINDTSTSATDHLSGAITLSGTNAITAVSGATLLLSGNVNGAADLSVSGAGGVTFQGMVGNTTALNSLSASVGVLGISNNITTSGSQSYSSGIVLAADAILKASGNGDIMLNNGISGNHNLTLDGGSQSNVVALSGTLGVNNVTVSGGSGTSNTLLVNSGDVQSWNISGTNLGSITGISEETGHFNFTNIQNIAGSNNGDTFTLNGGTIKSVTGGTGMNTLAADNVPNTFNITGANSGNITGVQTFTNIQNLMGGTSSNNFVFANNASISGNVNGNSSSSNTLDLSAYTNAPTVTISADNAGMASANNVNILSQFSNIQNVTGNGSGYLYVSANKVNNIYISSPTTASVDDPTTVTGFTTYGNSGMGSTAVAFAPSMQVVFISPNVATVNGVVITFDNISNYQLPPVPPSPPADNVAGTTISSIAASNFIANIVQSAYGQQSYSVTGDNPNADAMEYDLYIANGVNSNLDDIMTSQIDLLANSQRIHYVRTSCGGI